MSDATLFLRARHLCMHLDRPIQSNSLFGSGHSMNAGTRSAVIGTTVGELLLTRAMVSAGARSPPLPRRVTYLHLISLHGFDHATAQ
jgi:hypothetical protein